VGRGGEYAGNASDESGERFGVAGAAGRVEFPDRQRPHPLIARRRRERPCGLLQGRSGVSAVGVLRQRGIDKVEDVDVDGERARRAISEVGGRSGMVLRTSDSIRCRNSLNERQAPPSCRATWGRRSGPRRMMATTAITRSLPGSRLNMCLHSTVPLQGLDEPFYPLVM